MRHLHKQVVINVVENWLCSRSVFEYLVCIAERTGKQLALNLAAFEQHLEVVLVLLSLHERHDFMLEQVRRALLFEQFNELGLLLYVLTLSALR